jgi:hypothetical protein
VIDQVEPFHTSASGPVVDSPTATHSAARTHDTALSEAPPLGSGVGVIDHDHVLATAPIPGAAIPPTSATTGVPAVSGAVSTGVTVPTGEVYAVAGLPLIAAASACGAGTITAPLVPRPAPQA